MQKLMSLSILLMFFSAACVSVAELPEGVKIQAALPSSIQSVVLLPTTLNPHTIKNADGLTDAPEFFVRSLKSALDVKQFGWQIRMVDAQGTVPDAIFE